LSEKIILDNQADDELFTELHHDYKRANGYSDLEISQKRTALDNVLIRDSLATHQKRLHDVGFSRIQTWFQCFNFVSLVAIK
jgi:tRNA (cmo5U34)-methyltransferase